jgi:hypothetical protein
MEAMSRSSPGDPGFERPDPAAIESDGHGTLQEGDGDDETALATGGFNDSFGALERAFYNVDTVAGLEKRPRLDG